MHVQKGTLEALKWNDPAEELRGLAQFIHAQLEHNQLAPGDIKLVVPHASWGPLAQKACEQCGVNACFIMPFRHLSAEATRELAKLEILANPQSSSARGILQEGLTHPYNGSPCASLQESEESTDAFIARNTQLKGYSLLNVVNLSAYHEFAHALLHVQGDETAKDLFELVTSQLETPTIPEGVIAVPIEHILYASTPAKLVILMSCVEGLVPGVDAIQAPTEKARTTATTHWYEAFTRTTQLGQVHTYLSYFTNCDEAFAYAGHLPITRVKTQGKTRRAFVRPTPFLTQWGQAAPSTQGGQAFLRGLGLN
jgi:hypothetical protein